MTSKPATKPKSSRAKAKTPQRAKAKTPKRAKPKVFNIVIVAQSGRLTYEAIVFLASFNASNPDFKGNIFVAEPQDGPRWDKNPQMNDDAARELLEKLGAKILPFESREFGQSYPHGNKIECLQALPKGEPFIFFDTDTLITGDLAQAPIDFDKPCASRKVTGTWPKPQYYGPGYTQIWKSLYDRFGLDFESSLDLSKPDEYWGRYLYFNAGFFYYSCPHVFGQRFLEYAAEIKNHQPAELIGQAMDPWLDQVALPLVIHSLNGSRDAMKPGYFDGSLSCHYRFFPMLYARESDAVIEHLETTLAPNKIKKVLKSYDPIKRNVYQKRGHKVRALFDQENLPAKEAAIRQQIKRGGFWMR